jgi:hypothetical protein
LVCRRDLRFAQYVSFRYEVGEMPQRNSLTLSVYIGLKVLAKDVQHNTL